MQTDIVSVAPVARPPFHPTLVVVPITCFVGALLSDIVYSQTAEMMWTDFSAWLISAGVILGWLAVIAGIVDLVQRRYVLAPPAIWAYAIGHLAALVLATFNMLIHTHDAWTSVMPWGLTLSIITVLVLLAVHWIGWMAVYRRQAVVVVA